MLTALTQSHSGTLTDRVRDLPVTQFMELLRQITDEFEHFLKAIELINTESLELMLEQLLEAFTLKIGQILQADRTTIFLVDREREQLWSKIAQAEDGEVLELRVPLNSGIAGHVATTGEVLNIADAYAHPLFNKEIDRETGYLTHNILCMPIFNTKKNQVVAVVQLLNKLGDSPFSAEDEQQFREFAESIGIILESCGSFYVAARNQRGVAALMKATSFLGQSLDLEKTLQVVMNEARNLMHADRSTLFMIDRDKGELWSKVAKADGKTMMEIRIPADRGIAGYVASTGQTLNIPNAYDDPRFDPTIDQQTGYRTRNILCMPIYNSEGVRIGVTQLINKNQSNFTNSDEEFMQAFNIQAGMALENAKLFESVLLEKQYQKDILQSLSDAVISTDMQGRIVTINDAALHLLGCALNASNSSPDRSQWEDWIPQLLGRLVWEIVPIDHLQFRLEDSLKTGARHYVPEQSLVVGVGEIQDPESGKVKLVLATRDRQNPNAFIPCWNDPTLLPPDSPSPPTPDSPLPTPDSGLLTIQTFERSINLTVSPLTNPEGSVRGGLVVLEDISQEKRMKATMYRYMTPEVAERVMALGDDALMVGERKEVTILFSDIRSYTSLTEKMNAADVVALLNNYFETMVEAVFNFDGTLDKFIGDALMAVFGAPLPLENHAWMAVQSALDMRQRLAAFNQKRETIGLPPIRFGVGISSGEVVSGNIGSQKRMDYTVIGDGVDISSRLEGATKEYGCDIILSEFTYQFCQEKVWVRELDCVRVKGKTKPIRIYELIDDRNRGLDRPLQEFIQLYQAGREAYNQRNFKAAVQYFGQAQRLKPDDRATALLLHRASHYLQESPPASWDGVYAVQSK
ncbi:GAF domain-containing protein [Egbenema bharatensis]|uniref:GAF domain-containing protein n=1 Tax=Egbenema bharatensis TaxID=3463334 RepID=UPI003A88CDBA